MEYDILTRNIEKFDFIQDEQMADAAIKATLSVLAGRMEDPQAQKLAATLPEPFTFERLRSHQVRLAPISFDQLLHEISTQFKINLDQAELVTKTIFHAIKANIDDETLSELQRNLPEDWSTALHEA